MSLVSTSYCTRYYYHSSTVPRYNTAKCSIPSIMQCAVQAVFTHLLEPRLIVLSYRFIIKFCSCDMAVKLIVHTSPSRTTCLGGHPGPPRGRGGPTSHLPPQSPSRRVPPAIPHCCSASTTQALALARRARPLRASACCCTPTLR